VADIDHGRSIRWGMSTTYDRSGWGHMSQSSNCATAPALCGLLFQDQTHNTSNIRTVMTKSSHRRTRSSCRNLRKIADVLINDGELNIDEFPEEDERL
jgi:hypothetical protein